jgi:hypothetical protein
MTSQDMIMDFHMLEAQYHGTQATAEHGFERKQDPVDS